jgi:hypothetical protein
MEKDIKIDMFDFFKYGQFGNIKLGQTKDQILNNFPEPDNRNDVWNAWSYGNVEFFFDGDVLRTIFSDTFCFGEFSCGNKLDVNLWILKKPSKITLTNFLSIAKYHNIDYEMKINHAGYPFMILKNGVKILFENKKERHKNKHKFYYLVAFALSNNDYI